MIDPWNDIPLEIYESHMSLDNVGQLQALCGIMKEQFEVTCADTVMILGAAGGNGLENIPPERFEKVYCVDINQSYLDRIPERYPQLEDVTELICTDLRISADTLPGAGLLIADLIIEYIGYDCFESVVKAVHPEYVSCAVQADTGEGFVSESPYLHHFDGLESIHCSIDSAKIEKLLSSLGYRCVKNKVYPLPNGKSLVRVDGILDEKTFI